MKKYLYLLLLCCYFGCIEEIKLDGGDYEKLIVINGSISDSDESNYINVSYTVPFENQNFDKAIDIKLIIISDSGDRETLEVVENGKFLYKGKAENGKKYALEIYDSSDNLLGISEYEGLPASFPMDSLSFEESLKTYTNSEGNNRSLWTIDYFGHASQNFVEDDLYLRFGNFETVFFLPEITLKTFPPPIDCYIYNYDLQPKFELFEIKKASENINLKSLLLSKPITYEFAYIYSLKADLISMNQSSFEYWKQLETLYNQNGNITDKVPAQFKGNIKTSTTQNILGNFSVIRKSSKVVFTRRTDLVYKPLKLCGEVGGPYPYKPSDLCYYCLAHIGASKMAPSYW